MKNKLSEGEVWRFLRRALIGSRGVKGRVTLANSDHEVTFDVPLSVIKRLAGELANFKCHAQVIEDAPIVYAKFYMGQGEAIKRFRKKADLSQSELAKRLKIDRSNLVAIENGRRRVGRALALRIAEELGVSDYRMFL